MPRASYQAPGVYVEEVPSARQPIAGVGTNTVGFIGIVPDRIWIPVPNPKYDPVKSKAAVDAAGSTDAQKRELDDRVATAQREAARLKAEREALPADADNAAKTAARRRTEEAERVVEDLRRQRAALDTAAAPSAPVDFDSEDAAYEDQEPAQALREPSETRPYYFVPFDIGADEFATKLCTNFTEYARRFGEFSGFGDRKVSKNGAEVGSRFHPLHPGHHLLTHAVNGFFRNGGTRCFVARVKSADGLKKALERFESIDDVAIIAAPGLPKSKAAWDELQTYCEDDRHMNVFAILDCPAVVGSSAELDIQLLNYDNDKHLLPRTSTHAAYYFPHIEVLDPAKRLQEEDIVRRVDPKYRGLTHVAPSGHMAGIYARVDEERGVHKAPANAVVRGALEVKYYVSKAKQELLNPQGVNCIRIMSGAIAAWGARTIGGDRNMEWKYINVRRLVGYIEESIDEGTQWVVFEPNDAALWSKIRLNISEFLTNVWRSGALFGSSPEEAFYVKCDEELNPPAVRDNGQVITEIGVAPVRPAEFVVFRISQIAGGQKN